MSDPRVFFAAERTLLAWVRSGVTIIALGFVVARFGLFLELASRSDASSYMRYSHWMSATLGIALVVLGAAVILAALRNHWLYVRTLPPEDVPKLRMSWLTSGLALAVSAAGWLLALYLFVEQVK